MFAQMLPMPHSQWEFWGLVVIVLAPGVPAVLAWLKSFESAKIGHENKETLTDIKKGFNGVLEALIASTKEAAEMAGRLRGIDEERARQLKSFADIGEKAQKTIDDAFKVAEKLKSDAEITASALKKETLDDMKRLLIEAKATLEAETKEKEQK